MVQLLLLLFSVWLYSERSFYRECALFINHFLLVPVVFVVLTIIQTAFVVFVYVGFGK